VDDLLNNPLLKQSGNKIIKLIIDTLNCKILYVEILTNEIFYFGDFELVDIL
jgi:hypothetical protein